jgi:hypothetical protein
MDKCTSYFKKLTKITHCIYIYFISRNRILQKRSELSGHPNSFGDETDLVFSKNSGEHDHEVLDKCVLNRQKVYQVKRKAEDWICDRPAKIIHQELNSQKQCLETLTSKDIQYIRNNFGREKRKTFPKLPKSSLDVQNALNVLDIRTIIKDEQFLLINDLTEDIIVFSWISNIAFMSSQTKFYMDGTFDNCPKYFLQLHILYSCVC